MGSILCLSIAGIIVSTWPHAQFTLSSESPRSRSPSLIEGVWSIDDKRQRLRRLPAGSDGRQAASTPNVQAARAPTGQEWARSSGGASVERLTLARSGDGAREWVLCSNGECSRLESMLESSLAQSGWVDQQPVELSPCARTTR